MSSVDSFLLYLSQNIMFTITLIFSIYVIYLFIKGKQDDVSLTVVLIIFTFSLVMFTKYSVDAMGGQQYSRFIDETDGTVQNNDYIVYDERGDFYYLEKGYDGVYTSGTDIVVVLETGYTCNNYFVCMINNTLFSTANVDDFSNYSTMNEIYLPLYALNLTLSIFLIKRKNQ